MGNGSGSGHLVRRHIHPLERLPVGQSPDRSGFIHLLGDAVGTLNGGAVVCPILVKVAEGGGLNCEHVQRCLFDLIIEAAASDPRINSDSLLPVLVVGR